jgi:ABC-type uncharacterized transport system substrate-binding protein
LPDNFTSVHRGVIVAQAVARRLSAICPFRDFAIEGGLMSYGVDLLDLYGRAPTYVDPILQGAKPADLPMQAPAKIDLIINLKAAKAPGLAVPRFLIARADGVIE